jgi:hypothetical protein
VVTTYLLDSDVFIQAKNLHYKFSVVPGFWGWLDREHANGRIFSVKKVRDELLALEDELARWVKPRKAMFINTDDGKTYESLALLSGWASAKYQQAACAKFFGSADFQLVGCAHAHDHIVVTHERYSDGFEIKIPNACRALNVEPITVFELLEREDAKFVL